MLKIISWNVNGIRAGVKKGFWEKVKNLNADIVAIQETKTDKDLMVSTKAIYDQNFTLDFHSCTMKKGYSGVAIYTKSGDLKDYEVDSLFAENKEFTKDLVLDSKNRIAEISDTINFEVESVQAGFDNKYFDVEGRFLMIKYRIKENGGGSIKDFILINCYYPQGGRGQYRIDYKIAFYNEVRQIAKKLKEEGENVILCGDFNTTFKDIDLARPKENKNNTGCLPEEREALNWFVEDGFVDVFRHFYPDKEGVYSYWDQKTRARDRNVGWRIDFFLVDERLMPFIKSCEVLTEMLGSDHAPVVLDMKI